MSDPINHPYAEYIAHTNFTDSDEGNLAIVIMRWLGGIPETRYVTWIYSHDTQRFMLGHYFHSLHRAYEDYERRVERHAGPHIPPQ